MRAYILQRLLVLFVPGLVVAGCVLHRPPPVTPPVSTPEVVEPPGPEDLFQAGLTAARLGETATAEARFLDVLVLDPRHARARFALAVARAEASDLSTAEAEIQALLREDDDHAGAYAVLARTYFQHARYPMVLLVVEMSGARLDGDPEIHNLLGLTYLNLGEDALAAAEFQRTLSVDPSHLAANLNLGYLVLDFGAYTRAHDCFQAALAADPASQDARLGLAIALRGLADLESAVAEYDRILEREPDHRLALLNKAAVLDLGGDHAGALEVMEHYVAVHGIEGVEGRLEGMRRNLEEQRRIESFFEERQKSI